MEFEKGQFKNNKSALHNPEFVSSSIQEMICTERVAEIPFIRKVVGPFSVCSNKRGKRLILYFRYVNKQV